MSSFRAPWQNGLKKNQPTQQDRYKTRKHYFSPTNIFDYQYSYNSLQGLGLGLASGVGGATTIVSGLLGSDCEPE